MKTKTARRKHSGGKATATPYLPEELLPHSPQSSEAEIGVWLERNRQALDESFEAARKAYERGECLEVTSVEDLAARIVTDGRRQRKAKSK